MTYPTSDEKMRTSHWTSPSRAMLEEQSAGSSQFHDSLPSAPVAMSEARRRLVRDVYGRTSPWAPHDVTPTTVRVEGWLL